MNDKPASPDPTRPQIKNPAEASGVAPTALVVEDEGSVRMLVMGTLRGAGFTALAALDGKHALEICQDHPGPIHLMVTDYRMPGIDGGELIRRATLLRPDMKVIVITGDPNDLDLRPEVTVLEKPFTLMGLLGEINRLLGRPPRPEGHP